MPLLRGFHSHDRRDVDRAMSRDVLVLACAVSAGIHAALVPHHPEFAAAAVALAALATAVARSSRPRFVDAAAGLLASLVAAYVAATTTGIPILHPEPEPVTTVGVATKAIEAVGLLAALSLKGTLSWTVRPPLARFLSR